MLEMATQQPRFPYLLFLPRSDMKTQEEVVYDRGYLRKHRWENERVRQIQKTIQLRVHLRGGDHYGHRELSPPGDLWETMWNMFSIAPLLP